jgi:hypothetical protein
MSLFHAGEILDQFSLFFQAVVQIWLLLHVKSHSTRLSLFACGTLMIEALIRSLLYFNKTTPSAVRVFDKWRLVGGPQSPGHLLHLLTESEDAARIAIRIITLAWSIALLIWRVATILYYERRPPVDEEGRAYHWLVALTRFERLILGVVCLPIFLGWITKSCIAEFSTSVNILNEPIPKWTWETIPGRVQMCAAGPFGASDAISTITIMLTWHASEWPIEGYLIGKFLVVLLALSAKMMHDVNFSNFSLINRGISREILVSAMGLHFICLAFVLVPRLWKKRPFVLMLILSIWVSLVWLSRALGQGLIVSKISPGTDFANLIVSTHLLGIMAGGAPAVVVLLVLGNICLDNVK